MSKNIEITLAPGQNEVIIREGHAAPIHDPQVVNLSGILATPADYAIHRGDLVDKLKSNVVAHYGNRTIVLVVDEASKFRSTITGTLELNPDLDEFKINETAQFNHTGLLKLLKFAGPYFKDKDKHVDMITKLKKFEAKVNSEFENANDFKGASATKRLVDIKVNIGLEFTLSMPIFAGGPNQEFQVDICVDTHNNGVIFWLESVELHDLTVEGTKTAFDEQIKRLDGFLIVKQY